MIEIEVKARIRDPEKIKRHLGNLGYRMMRSKCQVDNYLKPTFRNFAETGEILRIRRQKQGPDLITYKGPKQKSKIKVREEIEVGIADGVEMTELLRKIGFEPWITVVKERTTYKSGNFVINIDKVNELGTFVEIETKISDRSSLEMDDEIISLLDKIGVSRVSIERKTYLELVQEKRSLEADGDLEQNT